MTDSIGSLPMNGDWGRLAVWRTLGDAYAGLRLFYRQNTPKLERQYKHTPLFGQLKINTQLVDHTTKEENKVEAWREHVETVASDLCRCDCVEALGVKIAKRSAITPGVCVSRPKAPTKIHQAPGQAVHCTVILQVTENLLTSHKRQAVFGARKIRWSNQ